ncbi:t-SNARE [Tilletiaria anomala UBC 951]|uniref:t-SNARE n=1 Tax=Tilletiaria anomala (strain ATCC 24038 / CBS 436.72 / UBC 951) TaxID=1037660 RepID=A0A066VJS7_TILAU|nr:t-SNARE [Tilletiaria anomala UBC 951]KDN41977.1 t-SNARE [Tilletiaria anomala UBC 951]
MMRTSYHPTPSSVRDRTTEFKSIIESIRLRNGGPAGSTGPATSARHRLLEQPGESSASAAAGQGASKKKAAKGEFAQRAQAIASDIASTTEKLGKLAQLARRKTLFDDRPVEISELTYIIKHDIAAINKQLADLQSYNKAQGKGKGGKGTEKVDTHRGNVVTLLQTKLAEATTSFQDILEVRTQNMKASKDRTDQFMFGGAAPAMPPGENSVLRSRKPGAPAPFVPDTPGSTTYGGAPTPPSRLDSPLYKPNRTAAAAHRQLPGYDMGGGGAAGVARGEEMGMGKAGAPAGADVEFLALDMGSSSLGAGGHANGGQYMQMQLMEHQDNYMQQRSTAIESIESTISELGSIFSQLAHMVAEQRETVQRIDENVYDVVDNVSGAQRELLKYYNSVSSNRWLMLKVFGVLIIFFLIFILVS